jgi:hypothetical protein
MVRNRSKTALFMAAGLAAAVFTFLFSIFDFRLTEILASDFGLNRAFAQIMPALILSAVLIYILSKLVFKVKKILIPLYFSLSVVYTLIFSFVFYCFSDPTWGIFIFIFLFVPLILAGISWLYFLAYFLSERFKKA